MRRRRIVWVLVILFLAGTAWYMAAHRAAATCTPVPYLGCIKPDTVRVKTAMYQTGYYTIEYPAAWAESVPTGSWIDALPSKLSVAGFAPKGNAPVHAVVVSNASEPQLEEAVQAAEATPAQATDVALGAGAARKLSFATSAAGGAVTYYLLRGAPGAPTIVLRLLGPGDKSLDEAGLVLLDTIARK